MKRDNMMMNDAAAADIMRKESMMMDAKAEMKRDLVMGAKQAADTSYGKYGSYGRYGNYGAYPGSAEKEAKKMQM
jgi:hypothetical protein